MIAWATRLITAGMAVGIPLVPPASPDASAPVRTRPLIIGHRGWSARLPENTLGAIDAALDAGADGVECDVRRCEDGHIVLMHDETVDRTTDGTGRVADLTLTELRALNACRPREPRFADVQPEPVPTLEEALTHVRGRGVALLDMKEEGIVEPVAGIVRGLDMESDVILCSWTSRNAERVREALPGSASAVIAAIPEDLPPTYFTDWTRVGVRCFSANERTVTPEFVRAAHLRAMSVFVWTVNEPERMQVLREMGVDAILTDAPDVAIEATMWPPA